MAFLVFSSQLGTAKKQRIGTAYYVDRSIAIYSLHAKLMCQSRANLDLQVSILNEKKLNILRIFHVNKSRSFFSFLFQIVFNFLNS